ncbi:MAG: L,D-transpeptidase, partial [Chitinivibrionia bacterium]|nr:L,D-transpeptidase [Chitinivibrionia bacterium]
AIGLGVAVLMAEKPPVYAFEQARLAVSQAKDTEAGRYVPALMRAAESRLEEARISWQLENLKWSPRRDFGKTRNLSIDAVRRARHAELRGVAVRDSLKTFTAARLKAVSSELNAFQSYYDDVPISGSHRQRAARTEVLLKASRAAYERGDYLVSAERVQEAGKLIDHAAAQSEQFLRNYMGQVSQWKRMASETISWSAKNKAVAIIVDKMDRVCMVYRSGRLSRQFPVELGRNWIGDKHYRGDKATPEGKYHVRKKKGPGYTRYYKALEIDYPNAADLQWFREAKRKGQVSARASIGGIIEIHGNGGRGENWTEGCVALKNSDMDRVFEAANVGTPVTIVGALDPAALEKNNHAPKRSGQ